MVVIPAIDLMEGKCVRLTQGRADSAVTYETDPAKVAKRWVSDGAEIIHIVDLEGAFSGSLKNLDAIKMIREAVDVKLQLGGGIRDIERVERIFGLGIDRVIIGTSAAKNPEFVREISERFPERIIVGIDARDGKVAVKGWEELTELDALEFAMRVQKMKIWGIIYTDISRDGMLSGPNFEAIERMVRALSVPVIASGGVSSIEDIRALKKIKGLWGVIIGKALYTGKVSLKEAILLSK